MNAFCKGNYAYKIVFFVVVFVCVFLCIFFCHVTVSGTSLLLLMPWVSLKYVNVAFPGHTHLLFVKQISDFDYRNPNPMTELFAIPRIRLF